MKEAYVLAIDIGTTSVKGLAVDKELKIFEKVSCPNNTQMTADGKREQDPAQLWQNVKQAIRILIEKCGQPAALCFSSAMHALMGVDQEGQALTPFLLWSDIRAIPQAAALRSTDIGTRYYATSGTPVHPMSPLVKLKWWKTEDPNLFEKANHWVGIKSWMIYQMTGEWYCDYSMASGTGLWDAKKKKWDKSTLAYVGITEEQLPQLVDTDFRLSAWTKRVANEVGVDVSVPIIMGGADGPLANLGANVDDREVPVLTIGTSGAMRIRIPEHRTDQGQKLFCYYLDKESFVIGGASNNGGNVFEWMKSVFGEVDIEKALAKTAIGAEGLFFIPYINGERAPLWDARCSGSFEGIQTIHQREHFVRAILEGVMLNMWMIGEELASISGKRFEKIFVSGGFLKSEAWAQMFADISGKSLVKGAQEDASGLGVAKIGWKALGETVEIKEERKIYLRPNMANYQKYRLIFESFKAIVRSKFDKAE
jgi:gluconokinase